MIDAIATAVVLGMLVEMRMGIGQLKKRLDEHLNKRTDSDSFFPTAFSVLIVCGAFFLVSACAHRPIMPGAVPVAAEPATAAGVFSNIGEYLLMWGAIGGVLGIVARVILGAGGLGGVALFLAEGGAVTAVCGAVTLWVADNMWSVYTTAAVLGAGWLWLRWPRLKRWFLNELAKRKASNRGN